MERHSQSYAKREELKAWTPTAISNNYQNGELTWSLCARIFSKKIGDTSHMRAKSVVNLRSKLVAAADVN